MRHAISKDYRQFEDAVRELHAEMVRSTNDPLLPDSTEWFVGSWVSWFNLHVPHKSGVVILAGESDIVGFCAAAIGPSIFSSAAVPNVGTVGLWWVKHEHRGRGVGGQLLAEAEAWLRNNGMRYIEAHYMAAVPGAEELWRRKGYNPYFVATRKASSE